MKDLNSGLVKYLENIDRTVFSKNEEIVAQFRFVLTQICNEKCFFCHNEGLPVERKFMDFESYKKIIDTIKKEGYTQKIRFTGGEPTLHKELYEFVNYARDQLPNTNIGMTTNGLLIRKQLDKILNSGLDSITVSLHSMIPERYKSITKVNGLGIVIDGLNKLREEGFKGNIKINSVINKKNIDEIPFFIEYTKNNNFELKLLPLLNYGNLKNNEKALYLERSELVNILGGEVLSEGAKVKEMRVKEKCTDCEHKNICGFEASYLRISPDGVLNPCLSMKHYDIDLKKLEYDSELLEKGLSLGLRRISKLDY